MIIDSFISKVTFLNMPEIERPYKKGEIELNNYKTKWMHWFNRQGTLCLRCVFVLRGLIFLSISLFGIQILFLLFGKYVSCSLHFGTFNQMKNSYYKIHSTQRTLNCTFYGLTAFMQNNFYANAKQGCFRRHDFGLYWFKK